MVHCVEHCVEDQAGHWSKWPFLTRSGARFYARKIMRSGSLAFVAFAVSCLLPAAALVADSKHTAKVPVNLLGRILKFPGGILKRGDHLIAKAKAAKDELAAAGSSESSLYTTLLVPLLAGGVATAFGDISVHPLDTIKTVQQAYGSRRVHRPRIRRLFAA